MVTSIVTLIDTPADAARAPLLIRLQRRLATLPADDLAAFTRVFDRRYGPPPAAPPPLRLVRN